MPGTSPGDAALQRLLAASVAAFFLATFSGFLNLTDGGSMYEVARSIVEDGDLTIPEGRLLSVPGRDGEHYSKYGIGLPALTVPAYVAGVAVSLVVGHRALVTELMVTAVMPVVYGLLAAAAYRFARRIGAGTSTAVLVGLGAVAGSFVVAYAHEFFSEPLVALLLVVAAERVLADRPVAGATALALAVVTRPQTAAVVPVFLLAMWLRGRWRPVVRALGPLAVGAIVVVAYNIARFGDALSTGYEGEGFTTPIHEGLRGVFLSPTKSVLLFAPIVILAPAAIARLARTDRAATLVVGGTAGAVLLTTATWHSWQGGYSWGPRLLVPALPLLVAGMAPWIDGADARRPLAIALLALGFLGSASTLVVPSTAQLVLAPSQLGAGPSIVEQYRLVPEIAERTAGGGCPPAGSRPREENRHCRLAFWQLEVSRVWGAPGTVAAGAATALLMAASAAAGSRIHVRLRRTRPACAASSS